MLNLDVIAVSTTGRVQPGGTFSITGAGGEVSRLLFRFPRHRSVRVDPPGERMIFVPPDFGHDNSNTV